jgi:uroporphyrinogen decarboxylase
VDSRQRIVTALDHREPDRVPFDLGSTAVTGIHRNAYVALRSYLGLREVPTQLADTAEQIAVVDNDLAERLGVDTRGIASFYVPPLIQDTVEDQRYVDDYGIGWRMPRDGGLYFDMFQHPLEGDPDDAALARYPWPEAPSRDQLAPMRTRILAEVASRPRAIVVESVCSGMMETASWLRGYEDFFTDVALEPRRAGIVLDHVLRQKLDYWDRLLDLVGDVIDVVKEVDDLGSQNDLLISPDAYRRLVKPRHRELFDLIHSKTAARVFFHSDGAIRKLIPDLIDVGVDILNPVQVNAAQMDTRELKAEFGKDLSFWGGGIDTQRILCRGTKSEIQDEVRRRLDDLMPGGGFVFATVHNVQADVSPESFMTMWDTVKEFGSYQ